jgi:membrane associated rhomboid family serine protease
MRFARALLLRPYKFTIVFLAANIFVFLLMWDQSGLTLNSIWAFDTDILLRFGAKLNVLIDQEKQWWRFVTPVFEHVGLIHLLFNMYGLWVLGPYVERLYGSAKFVVFWVVTGVAGVVASYLTLRPELSHGWLLSRIFKSADMPSAGASGALFGLIGVLFVFGIKYRHELPEGFKRAFGTGMLPTILLNLIIGFSVSFIDNSAHLGGLIAGAALALVTDYKRPGKRGSATIVWTVLQILCLALVVVSFVEVARHFRDPIDSYAEQAALSTIDPSVRAYLKAMGDGDREVQVVLSSGDLSTLDSVIAELDRAPALDQDSGALKAELKQLLIKLKQLDSLEPQDSGGIRAAVQQIDQQYAAFHKRYEEWLRVNLPKYGLELRNAPK